ncbi:MAG: flippase-like domain-containing protein [Archaeoglobaceae archaeon]|nr:flippase-like domain-containing protein [Archaeoglobaceae archaeon]MDW8117422.1 flippase-like domain-containing protein [Archaeoglobaceae archaeon]
MKGLRSALLGILISLVTTMVIFKITETSLTWELLSRVNFAFLLLAVIFQVIFWLLWALRLNMISKYLQINVSYSSSVEITLNSMFFAAITPSSAGGEPVRIKMLSDKGMALGKSTFVVITERVLDSIFFILALPIFLIFTGFATELGYRVAIIFILVFIFFLYFLYSIFKDERSIQRFSKLANRIFKRRKITDRIEIELKNFREGSLKLLSDPIYLLILFTMTALMWSATFFIPSLILLSFSQDPHFLISYTSQLIIVVISLIPLTPGSSGIVETSMAYLYSNFVDLSILGSLVAVWRLITYHLNIIFGAITLNARAFKKFFN